MDHEGAPDIVSALNERGFNVDPAAVPLIAASDDPMNLVDVIERTVDSETIVVRPADVERARQAGDSTDTPPPISPAETERQDGSDGDNSPVETEGSRVSTSTDSMALEVRTDMTGRSTGTGEYRDFVAMFRDRLDRLGEKLRNRVNHRPASSLGSVSGGTTVSMVGLVNDLRSTTNDHKLIELEDTTGTFPWLVLRDRDVFSLVDELMYDEVIALEGTMSDDGGIAFVDSIYFPDVPRTYEPSTAERHVQAALLSDLHVGSQEFQRDAWTDFVDWLATDEASSLEYILFAGDMVEGVGVYPDQDRELDIIDIYDQYRRFNELLKELPSDVEIIMIPGNHDAVRLAEPQPGFDEDIRSILSANEVEIVSNPSTVTIEGVSILMYHGVSLFEVITDSTDEDLTMDTPEVAMNRLLKKRHLAPQFGGLTRIAPEERDHLIIDEIPDVFHTGHLHKFGVGRYHNVVTINSGCWQAQTEYQRRNNIVPDVGYAPIVDLDTLEVTVRKFT